MPTEIHTVAHPTHARDVTFGLFAADGCEVRPTTDYSAEVERGSVALTLFFGAFMGKKQYLRYTVDVFTAPGGQGSVVRLTRKGSGAMAGAIGMARARRTFTSWQARVTEALPH
jgi:hypothetical protein